MAQPSALLLGIEGGGTRTVALMADSRGRQIARAEFGPANLKLVTDSQLTRHFMAIAKAMPHPDAVGIGLAGGWEEADWKRIRAAAAKVWPGVPCCANNDLESALMAATERPAKTGPQVIIVSGTGSCCYGKSATGKVAKVGGWGHVLGDRGSGYDIGLQALQRVVADYDTTGRWPGLGRRLLATLQLNAPNDLIDWAQHADKTGIAALAPEVFAGADQGDALARDIIRSTAERLACDAAACARKLSKPGTPVTFVLTGSILLKQTRFSGQLRRHLCSLCAKASIKCLEQESVWGAVALAATALAGNSSVSAQFRRGQLAAQIETKPSSARTSPTEQRNVRSMKLDKLPLDKAIDLMLSEDGRIPRRLRACRPQIEAVIEGIVTALKKGGRLFYVGAGTSGRLGVLDASECPPTFCTSPQMVQGIIAGGQAALWSSVEGAEDDTVAGSRAVAFRGVNKRDYVIGIAASGTTPFVWGALAEAKRRRARTTLLCFNPYLQVPRNLRPDIILAPNVGPEILTGSTRLKAGTATKLLLNMFTTLAMVRLGKVASNLMVDVNPANTKLRERAIRIVQALTAADPVRAEASLKHAHWNVRIALASLARRERPVTQVKKRGKVNGPGRQNHYEDRG